ncbi:transcriptional regulator, Crp family [Campylobacter iguaniorum]|nr:transcriptional regulator, Crp family [Campylobacter iguaniorum]
MLTTRLHLGEYRDFELLKDDDLSKFRHFKIAKSSIIYANNIKFLIIKDGSAKLSYIDGSKEFIINFLQPGNMIFLDKNCVVEMLSDSDILELNIKDISELFENRDFSMSLVNSLIRNVVMQRQIIADIVFGNLELRLENFLRNLANEQNENLRDKSIVTLPFSITVLANLLGFERQSVSTTFNKLLRSGVLQKYGKNKFILA